MTSHDYSLYMFWIYVLWTGNTTSNVCSHELYHRKFNYGSTNSKISSSFFPLCLQAIMSKQLKINKYQTFGQTSLKVFLFIQLQFVIMNWNYTSFKWTPSPWVQNKLHFYFNKSVNPSPYNKQRNRPTYIGQLKVVNLIGVGPTKKHS